jgi:hypothetical protein
MPSTADAGPLLNLCPPLSALGGLTGLTLPQRVLESVNAQRGYSDEN